MVDCMEGSDDSPPIHRSISMPVKPRYMEDKLLQRSEEKEILYEEDFNSDSPIFGRRKKFTCCSKSPESLFENDEQSHDEIFEINNETNLPKCAMEWAGSTIELNSSNLRRNEVPITSSRNNKRSSRVVEKNGRENVTFHRIPEKSWRYCRDFVTTLIEQDWKYTLSLFLGSYFLSWFIFAVLWYMIAYSHGDLLFDEVTGERLGEGKDPCIMGVSNFLSILIYSIETQTTIGFGEKYPSEECPESIFLFIMQIIISIGIEGGMISIIYAKTARPARQITKLKFSDKAVICYRDGKLCLMFRICDPREQQTIGSKIRVYLLVDRPTNEGEIIKTHTELKLECNGNQMIMWPEIVCHVIDDASPLNVYSTAKDLTDATFELFVSIVGTSPATAQMTEARTSYLPREIYWGQRFVNVINYDTRSERYVIDYMNFNTTISVDMNTNNTNQLQ